MAVEIRELVIRAVIVNDDAQQNPPPETAGNISREEIIQQCVNEVLKIIRKSKYR